LIKSKTQLIRQFKCLRTAWVGLSALFMASWAFSFKDTTQLIFVTAFGLAIEAIAEPLTGRIADIRGRVSAMISGFSFICVGFFLMFMCDGAQLGPGLILKLVAWTAFLLGSCLFSGTAEAWIVDELRAIGDTSATSEIFAPVALLENLAWLPAGLIRFIPEEQKTGGPPYWWIVGIIASLILIIYIANNVWETLHVENLQKVRTLSAIKFLQNARDLQRNNPVLRYLAGGYCVSYVLWFSVAQFWIPTMKSIQPDTSGMSAFWLAFCLARLFGSLSARTSLVQAKEKRYLLITVATIVNVVPVCLLAILLTVNALPGSVLSVVCISCFSISKIGEEFIKPLRKSLIMDNVDDSSVRATMMSLSQASGAFLMFVIFVIFSSFFSYLHRVRNEPATDQLIYGILFLFVGGLAIASIWLYGRIGGNTLVLQREEFVGELEV
jgi:MFS family permease